MADGQTRDGNQWFYSDIVKDHFFNPRNLLKTEEAKKYEKEADGVGKEGSPACLTGDTLIAVADGRVSVPIKQLADEKKQVPVYCYDGEKITISKATNFRKTRKKAQIIQVNLEDGSSFKATPDHKIMLRDGTYTEVRNFVNGMSLMPYHKVTRKGYFYVYLNNGQRVRDHEIIFEYNKGPISSFGIENPNIHHIDGNKLNNSIKNLQLLSAKKHARLHSVENKKFLKGVIRNIEGDENPMRKWWNSASKKEKQLYRLTMSFATSGRKNGRWIPIENKKILKEAYEFFIIGNKKLTNENWRRFAKEKGFPQCVNPRFNSFNEFKDQVSTYNHRVSSIQFVGYEDVYNTTVKNFHNFAIITNQDDLNSGVIVKNCGDMMKMWIKVQGERIYECRWQTFGCASAIASTSAYSEMITENGGMSLEEALQVKPKNIMERLGGLPNNKVHCSVLADKALRAAVNDYYRKTEQYDKIKESGRKVIDKILKITDHDIEEAVLEGARTFEDLQKKTKIGIQDKNCIPEAEQLLRFYIEKYFKEELQ